MRRKINLIKEDKLQFSKIETKSNNIKVLGEDLVLSLNNFTGLIDNLHYNLVTLKSLITWKEVDHEGKALKTNMNI